MAARRAVAPEFRLGEGVTEPVRPVPYRRHLGEPVLRVLRVYTQDPGLSRSDGAIAEVEVPWEPLGPGPTGHIFTVRDVHQPTGHLWTPVDLDDPVVAADRGIAPSSTDPRFAQQMTYAVAMRTYEAFRQALGRLPEFSPSVRRARSDGTIELRPHWDQFDNAYYDPDEAAMCFGYVRSRETSIGSTQPGAFVFTALSHDVVAHETAHALLDGMRPHLMRPSNPDVAAFHEAFADTIALLLRFRYRDVVRRALEDSADHSLDSTLLTDLARQWGRTGNDGRSPLRRIVYRQGTPEEPVPPADRYDPRKEHHDLGAVLVAAIFEAMSRVFRAKTHVIRKIAAQSPASRDYVIDLLTGEARRLAGQFLTIVIRAIDYCPPVDITFGEYLRALITADWVVVPDDPHHYRESLILAFRRYGITVPEVPDLSEGALLWRPPSASLAPIQTLGFGELQDGAGWATEPDQRLAAAGALGQYVTRAGHHAHFGLAPPGRRASATYHEPVIESVRTLRRLTPDDELEFQVVAEVSQCVTTNGRNYFGGSTVVLDADGGLQFVIRKRVDARERHARTDRFLSRAPAEYREAFEAQAWRPGPVVKRFHARSKGRQ